MEPHISRFAKLIFIALAGSCGASVAWAGQTQNVFFVIADAAAEVAVGLAWIVEIFKSKRSIDVDQMNSMKG